MKEQLYIYKNRTTPIEDYFPNGIPDKFPAIDKDGDVWLDKKTHMFTQPGPPTSTTREERRIYWRYKKAWELMNR